jgi:hypothetical protein
MSVVSIDDRPASSPLAARVTRLEKVVAELSNVVVDLTEALTEFSASGGEKAA